MRLTILATAASLSLMGLAAAEPATAAMKIHTEIAAQDLDTALQQLMSVRDLHLVYVSEDLHNQHTRGAAGELTAAEALTELLSGTGLTYRYIDDQTMLIVPLSQPTPSGREGQGNSSDSFRLAQASTSQDNSSVQLSSDSHAPREEEAGGPKLDQVVVTGSRIRGAEPTVPVIVNSRETIEQAGLTDLGSFARTLPQNFSGGQNPGVTGGGDQGGSENLNSSSALNLRGLGPDATLTLINGHRAAYDGAAQGVDISAIPLAAVDRVEVVADGASALYGSDAVGGVANIVLRRDYQGLLTSARFGSSTDGGNEQQQYSAVTGAVWGSGGFMAALDFNKSTAITARQRSYTSSLDDTDTLVPGQRQRSAVLAGHQDLGAGIEFELDAQYSDRRSSNSFPFSTTGPVTYYGFYTESYVRSLSITPSLRFHLPASWEVILSGTYGDSLSHSPGWRYSGGSLQLNTEVVYDNRLDTTEVSAEGPVISLPGGDLRLAVGGGYRGINLDANGKRTSAGITVPTFGFDEGRRVTFGYAEASLPLIGAHNAVPGVHRLTASAAMRYERYSGIDDVTTPKLGITFEPTEDVSIKGSWGKSFKAPTLYQQFNVYQAILLPAYYFSSTPLDPSQNVVLLGGGNPQLGPERATDWTTTLSWHPRVLPGFSGEASYFNIQYRDRVLEPLQSAAGSLTNPVYQHLITHNPTASQIDAAAARDPVGLENQTTAPYDPASVIAIVNDSLQNVARQSIKGVDLSTDYRFDVGAADHVTVSASGSHLQTDQQLLGGSATIQGAGRIFYPPHWRARSGAVWDRSQFALSTFVNYIGGTIDNRYGTVRHVASFTSMDTTARIRTGASQGALKDLDFTLAILNLLNQKPGTLHNSSPIDPPYDSTNYPVAGRIVSLMVAKKW